jgi:hypothetical protein
VQIYVFLKSLARYDGCLPAIEAAAETPSFPHIGLDVDDPGQSPA